MAETNLMPPRSKEDVIKYLQWCVEECGQLACSSAMPPAPDGLASSCDNAGARLYLTFGDHDFTVMVMDHTVRDRE